MTMALNWTPPWRAKIREAQHAADEAAADKRRAYEDAGILRQLGDWYAEVHRKNGFAQTARTTFGIERKAR